jgi:hypothetical protein
MKTLLSAIEENNANLRLNIRTCIPCKVVNNNNIINGRIDVQPILKGKKIGNGELTKLETGEYAQTIDYELPYILDCPVCTLINSIARITLPISVGDQGLLIISDRDISNWKNNNNNNLASIRKFDINDGFFLPFINQNISNYSTNSLVINYNGNIIEITDSNITLTGNVIINGTLNVSKETTIKNIAYSTHTHPYINTPPSNTGAPNL